MIAGWLISVAEAIILFIVACLCLVLVVDIIRKDGFTEMKAWAQECTAALTVTLIPDVSNFYFLINFRFHFQIFRNFQFLFRRELV